MNDEEALLRAICAEPDEDTPRLVFADWLDEQGGHLNSAWAELIRVQVALARGAGPDRHRLSARECELTPEVAEPWPARMGLPAGLRWKDWVRGFPLTLAGEHGAIRAGYAAFAGRVPVREMNFRAASDADLFALATWPEARQLRKLGVWTDGPAIGPWGLIALSTTEHLCDLERLQVQWVQYTEAAVEAFLASPHLARLVSVKVVGHGFGGLSEEVRQQVAGRFGQWDIY